MPLEFIPNQPVVFEHPIGTYPCLNNDPKAYGPLMQQGDEMCMQWKMTPCGTPLCEPDGIMDPTVPVSLSSWSVTNGWSSSSSTSVSFDGSGGIGVAEQNLGTLADGFYKVTFYVYYQAGQGTFLLRGDYGQVLATITEEGSYTVYFSNYTAPFILQFITLDADPSGYVIDIVDIQVTQMTTCWQDGFYAGLSSFNYSYDALTQQGKFCSLGQEGSLINTQAFINFGNYHGITFVISNCTQGGVEVYVDGGITPIGTTSGNGQFSYYGNPANFSLIFVKAGGFDGCISQVVVNDYGMIGDYDISFANANNTTTSSIVNPTVYDDRLVWCGTMDDLTWNINGVPDAALGCDQLFVSIYDPCDDVTHTSVNAINYNNLGHDCTKFVEAWNDGYAFGFYFGDVNAPDFKLKQRLRVLAFNPVYRNSGEEYLYSSGQTVRSYAQSQKARTAWFDYADEYCHDTIRTQLLSQKLTVEGVSFYFPTEDYEPEWNDRGRYNLAQSRVTLFHELSTFGSTCGIIANPFCPPTQQAAIITQVSLKMDAFDTTGFDLTNINYSIYEISANNVYSFVGAGSGLDLTIVGNRTILLNDIITALNAYYNTSFSGTISLSGSILTIDCSAQINTVLPVKTWSITLNDVSTYAIPITTTFQ